METGIKNIVYNIVGSVLNKHASKQQLEPRRYPHSPWVQEIAELTILCDAPGLPLSCALVMRLLMIVPESGKAK